MIILSFSRMHQLQKYKCSLENTNIVFSFSVMQQSAAEKDRGRSGKIENNSQSRLFLCFSVDRTSLPLWVEKDHKVLRIAWRILLLLNAYVTVTQNAVKRPCSMVSIHFNSSLSLIWIYFAVVWFNLELHWDGDKGREKGDKTSAVVGCTKCYQDQIQWAGNEIIISGSAQASCN